VDLFENQNVGLFSPHPVVGLFASNAQWKPSEERLAERAVDARGELMKQPVKSKRRTIGSARFEVQMEVEFLGLTPGGIEIQGTGIVRNLSMRGALIETDALVKTDDHLTLFLTLPNQAELLEIPAVAIRWFVRRHQLGVEFLKLDRQTSRKLMKYLAGTYNAARARPKAV
jgi:hypothetical protein